jgi:hypothetical protein
MKVKFCVGCIKEIYGAKISGWKYTEFKGYRLQSGLGNSVGIATGYGLDGPGI